MEYNSDSWKPLCLMFKKQPVASFIFLMEKKNKKKNKAVHGILFNFIFYCLYIVVIIKKKRCCRLKWEHSSQGPRVLDRNSNKKAYYLRPIKPCWYYLLLFTITGILSTSTSLSLVGSSQYINLRGNLCTRRLNTFVREVFCCVA